MENIKVYVLLASYNGEEYIEQQIESIINQTFTSWKLIIRDDGSNDKTISIIKSLSMRDKRIELIVDDDKNLGAFGNFYRLTEYANQHYEPDYVLYSDQDDFWFNDKIEILLQTIKYYEDKEIQKPILIHSNYQLADQNLNPIFKNNIRDNVDKMNKQSTFYNTIFQNNIYGCTTIVNKLLINKSLEEYVICENHDHWMALNALWDGAIFYLNKKLMLYRQHYANVTGSYLTRKPYYKKIYSFYSELEIGSIFLLKSITYLDYFRKKINLEPFVLLDKATPKIIVSKKIIWFCMRNRITKNTLHETIFFYLCLFYSLLANFRSAKNNHSKIIIANISKE